VFNLFSSPHLICLCCSPHRCCGYAELLKLHVYGMVEHELVVHLDFDSLLLRPMDDLFDVMLGKGGDVAARRRLLPLARLPRTREVDFSRPIDAAFTRDYNSVIDPGVNSSVGFQGGFLVVRPDLEVLERFRTILQRGEFVLGQGRIRDGWGGKHGGFTGDATFQGILPYYYEDVAPEGQHNEVELDRCIYNQMADNPRKSTHKFPRATPLDPKKMVSKTKVSCETFFPGLLWYLLSIITATHAALRDFRTPTFAEMGERIALIPTASVHTRSLPLRHTLLSAKSPGIAPTVTQVR
jgi:hypothetical protein